MRYPNEWYHMYGTIATHLPDLRPAQQRGLALWVYGTILAQNASQSAVLTALSAATQVARVFGTAWALRQALREWLYDGADKAAPCATQVEVRACFPALLRWVVSWWEGHELALALDATTLRDQVSVLSLSLLYRGCAIPIAWHVTPGNQPAAWIEPLLALLPQLAAVVPAGWRVLVLTDRGLNSAPLRACLRRLGWQWLMRQPGDVTFAPAGQDRRRARQLVSGPGEAWVGYGTAFRAKAKQQPCTLVVVWAEAQEEPWLLLTDVPPAEVGLRWYGLRMWVELGFRALKGLGWQWQRTRRTDVARVERHWLVLAVATLWVLAYGTRSEEAAALGVRAGDLRVPPAPRVLPPERDRRSSVFQHGWSVLSQLLGRGRLWRRVWLRHDPWPDDFSNVQVTVHLPPEDD
jgi:hypothetical protein